MKTKKWMMKNQISFHRSMIIRITQTGLTKYIIYLQFHQIKMIKACLNKQRICTLTSIMMFIRNLEWIPKRESNLKYKKL
jgi:hypothetical protein